MLDRPATAPEDETASPSPVIEPQQISSDPEPDADDWDVERPEGVGRGEGNEEEDGEEGGEEGGDEGTEDRTEWDPSAWADMNDEVEQALAESDSDEEGGDGEDGASLGEGDKKRSVEGSVAEDENSSVGRYVTFSYISGPLLTAPKA